MAVTSAPSRNDPADTAIAACSPDTNVCPAHLWAEALGAWRGRGRREVHHARVGRGACGHGPDDAQRPDGLMDSPEAALDLVGGAPAVGRLDGVELAGARYADVMREHVGHR